MSRIHYRGDPDTVIKPRRRARPLPMDKPLTPAQLATVMEVLKRWLPKRKGGK